MPDWVSWLGNVGTVVIAVILGVNKLLESRLKVRQADVNVEEARAKAEEARAKIVWTDQFKAAMQAQLDAKDEQLKAKDERIALLESLTATSLKPMLEAEIHFREQRISTLTEERDEFKVQVGKLEADKGALVQGIEQMTAAHKKIQALDAQLEQGRRELATLQAGARIVASPSEWTLWRVQPATVELSRPAGVAPNEPGMEAVPSEVSAPEEQDCEGNTASPP